MGLKNYVPETSGLPLYWFLAGLRIILTLLPQRGYIHPDEYFQSIEVVAGDVFNLDVNPPWEFNVTFPIRSILLPKVVVGIPYILLQLILPLLSWITRYNIPTAYTLIVVPRIVACALSFVTDYCLYRICLLHKQKYHARLMVLGSSYVMLVYGTRTFSNSVEMALSSLLLFLVADSMAFTKQSIEKRKLLDTRWEESKSPVERVKLFKVRATLPDDSTRHCFSIASIVIAGIFNRATFVAFGFIPVFFWLQRGLGSPNVGLRVFHYRMLLLVVSALPSLFLFIFVDSMYYSYLSWVEIGMREVSLSSFVVTPFNFLLYNSKSSNLAEHGLHPLVTHIFVNLPLLYNVLGLIGLFACVGFINRAARAHWNELPRSQSLVMLMTGSILTPLGVLSLIPHQESRFLIPITLPLIFLHAQEVHDLNTTQTILYHTMPTIKWNSKAKKPFAPKKEKNSRSLRTAWVVINTFFLIFFGFLHQGGVYPLADYLQTDLYHRNHPNVVHLVTSHLYSFPQSLLFQPKNYFQHQPSGGVSKRVAKRKFFLTEMGSRPLETVSTTLEDILTSCSQWKPKDYVRCTVFLALPSSLLDELNFKLSKNLTYKVERKFYPHVSTEAIPGFHSDLHTPLHNCYSENSHMHGESKTHDDGDIPQGIAYSPSSILCKVLKIFKQMSLSLVRVQKQTK